MREREYHQPRMNVPVSPSPNYQGGSSGGARGGLLSSVIHHNPQHHHLLDVDYEGRLSRSSSLRSNAFTAAAAGEFELNLDLKEYLSLNELSFSGEMMAEVDAMVSASSSLAQRELSLAKKRQTNIEKQVTLEDQAICGALQTLNEEAMEDVLDEREADMLSRDEMLHEVQHHGGPSGAGYISSNISTCSDPAETEFLYLQTSVVMPDLNLANSIRGSRAFIGNNI